MRDILKHFICFLAIVFFYPVIKYAVDRGWKPQSKKLRAIIAILNIVSFFFWLLLCLIAFYMLKTMLLGTK